MCEWTVNVKKTTALPLNAMVQKHCMGFLIPRSPINQELVLADIC